MLFILFTVCVSSSASWDFEIMPVDKVEPGMTGTGRTVFYGTDVEEFDVEVLDIITDHYPDFDVILVRLSGDKAEKNGVVSGMSGSPVYIDGKLIGAIAYRFGQFQKEPIAGVVPIEYMMDVAARDQYHDEELAWRSQGDSLGYLNTALCGAKEHFWSRVLERHLPLQESGKSLQLIPTPLVFSGFSGETVQALKDPLVKHGFHVMTGGSGRAGHSEPKPFEPGSPVSAMLISGDASIAATGTVTAVSGDALLAFGHQVFNLGPISLPLAHSRVVWTIPSYMASSKMTVPLELAGTFRQDRMAGSFGDLSIQPSLVPVSVTNKSPFHEPKTYHLNMANDRALNNLLPFYLQIALIQAMNVSRLAGGTSSVHLTGAVELADGRQLEFDDLFSSSKQLGYAASGTDFNQASSLVASVLGALMVNDFDGPEVASVDICSETIPGQRKATIRSVWANKTEVAPGDTIRLTVTLQDQDDRQHTITKNINVPENLRSRSAAILISGGSLLTQYEMQVNRALFVPHSFDGLITILENRNKSQKLYIQLRGRENSIVLNGKPMMSMPPSVMHAMSTRATSGSVDRLRDQAVAEKVVEMDYVVNGIKRLPIKVKKPQQAKAPEDEKNNAARKYQF